MFSDNLALDYSGFSPTFDDDVTLRAIAFEILQIAPRAAIVHLTINKIGGDYNAKVIIESNGNTLMAWARHIDLHSLGRRLLQKVRWQVEPPQSNPWDGVLANNADWDLPTIISSVRSDSVRSAHVSK